MSSFVENYSIDCTIIKEYGQHGIKVINMNACLRTDAERRIVPKCSVNDAKLKNNLSRAKTRVKEIALCNEWDFWCTFTISPEKYDRYNLKAYYKDFAEFIHNYNKRSEDKFKVRYLLIPELHKDGAWHIHGLIRGIRANDLYINQYNYLTWRSYEERFGFISMSVIRDIERTANYALKYMTKDAEKNVTELEAHSYYCSKGLNRAKTCYKGFARVTCEWDYVGDYCRLKWFDRTEEGIRQYLDSVELFRDER